MSKRKNIGIILIFICSCLLIISLFTLFTKNTTVINSYVPEDKILFTPDDGGEPYEISVADAPEPRFDGVYTSYYTIPASDGTAISSLSFLFGIGEVEIAVDGNVLYTGQSTGSSPISLSSTPDFFFTADNTSGALLTVTVRYTDETFLVLPGVLTKQDLGAEARLNAAITNMSAIPAGIMGFSFLIIITLFLIGVALVPTPDYSLPFLALGTLCLCVHGLLVTGAVDVPDSFWDFRQYVLPSLAILLILIYILWNRKKKILKYFLIFSGVVIVLILLAYFLRTQLDHVPIPMMELSTLIDLVTRNNLTAVLLVATNYLVMICVVASLVYHVRSLVDMAAEKATLEGSARAVTAGYERMVESMKTVTAARHEWKHDLLTLSLLYDQGKTEEIGAYLQEKNDFIRKNELESLTGCFALDVIINHVSARAKNEGVELKTYIHVPSDLNIKEEDLCQLLLNMFDNAFNACAKVQGKKYIDFTAELKGNFLAVRCTNSAPPVDKETKASAAGSDMQHGYGIKNMKKICQSYGSDLVFDTDTPDTFTVKTVLQLNRNEE